MYKFFQQKLCNTQPQKILESEVVEFYNDTVEEMKKNGAKQQEINLLHESAVRNAIINKRKPEDLAWAILQ